ncbi:hypothetical protein [Buttiauxella sp. JUb87]|jgi:hypothetical protein|nr:hypothetical protein [Buttiauxella sp. JUb87]
MVLKIVGVQILKVLLVISKGSVTIIDPDEPRTIEPGDGWLSLVPVKE